MAEVRLRGVTVTRAGTRVLDGVGLHARDGERVVVLGPSGAGKTTLLRCIAGLEALDAGTVLIGGRDVTDAPARERDVAMADQHDSLQPRLDVHDNLAFPLRLRGAGAEEVEQRVTAEARTFSLRRLLSRRPATLAAGERHEVALARSLVRRSAVLLLDEPLARVDAGRRSALGRELCRLQEGYGLTTVVATNDQRAGLLLAERLVVLDAGRVAQDAPPSEVYERPASLFVAGFVGSTPMNILPGTVTRTRSGRVEVRTAALAVPTWAAEVTALADRPVVVGLRPEALRLATAGDRFTARGRVTHSEFLGASVAITLSHGPDAAIRILLPRPAPAVGDPIEVAVEPDRIHLFAPDGPALAHGV